MLHETLAPLTTCDTVVPILCPRTFLNEKLQGRICLEVVSTLLMCSFECKFIITLSVLVFIVNHISHTIKVVIMLIVLP